MFFLHRYRRQKSKFSVLNQNYLLAIDSFVISIVKEISSDRALILVEGLDNNNSHFVRSYELSKDKNQIHHQLITKEINHKKFELPYSCYTISFIISKTAAEKFDNAVRDELENNRLNKNYSNIVNETPYAWARKFLIKKFRDDIRFQTLPENNKNLSPLSAHIFEPNLNKGCFSRYSCVRV